MYRQGLATTPLCNCSQERETIEHYILRCPQYNEERMTLLASYYRILQESSMRHNAAPTLQTFIGLRWDMDLPMEDELKIKEAVFTFLESTD